MSIFDIAFVENLYETAADAGVWTPDISQGPPLATMHRDVCVGFDGKYKLTIQFHRTKNKYHADPDQEYWHLSVLNSDGTEADEDIANLVVMTVFGQEEYMELPRQHLPQPLCRLRQYVREA